MARDFLNGLLAGFAELRRQSAAPDAPAAAGARIYTFNADGHTVLEGRIEGGGRFRFLRDQNLIGRNNTGATIAAGTFVRITGWDATAQVLTIAPADPSAESTMPAVGVVNAAIANGASGRVWQMGIVTGLNTGGMTVGGEIYLAASGAFTQTKPTAVGARLQELGTVVVADTSAGQIHANVTGGFQTIPAGGTQPPPQVLPLVFDHSSGVIFTNMSANLVEQFPKLRSFGHLARATRVRLTGYVAVAGPSAAELRVQYSTDLSTWAYLDGGTGPSMSIGGTGIRVSSWVNLVTGAKADIYLRVLAIGGDGALDPNIASMHMHYE